MAISKTASAKASVSAFVPEAPQGVQVLLTLASTGVLAQKHREMASGQAILTVARIVDGTVETETADGDMLTWTAGEMVGAGITVSFADNGALLDMIKEKYNQFTNGNDQKSGAISFLALVSDWSVNAATKKFVARVQGIINSSFVPAVAEIASAEDQKAAIMAGKQAGRQARETNRATRLANTQAAQAGVATVAAVATALSSDIG